MIQRSGDFVSRDWLFGPKTRGHVRESQPVAAGNGLDLKKLETGGLIGSMAAELMGSTAIEQEHSSLLTIQKMKVCCQMMQHS